MGSTRACMLGLVVSAAVGVTAAAAAAPVAGSIAGPVTAVNGSTFTVKTPLSPTGSSNVHVGSTTVVSEQASGTRTDLVKGVCVTAIGSKSGKGEIAATRVMVTAPTKGQCSVGFGRGQRPNGGPRGGASPPRRPPTGAGGFADVGFANGAITAVKGSTYTVHGPRGPARFTLASSAQITRTVRVGPSAIKAKLCVFVRGTSADKGITVTAQDVALSKPGPGGCTPRFRRP